jgi:hypothetical protein
MAKIKVSEATVAKLRKGTMAGNLAKAKGASPEMKEALTRFYGAKRVAAAIGKSGPGSTGKPKPFTPSANTKEDRKAKATVTSNMREGRKPDRSPKPTGGPGSKPKPARPTGGPGSKPRPSKGQTPNQREGRKTMTSPKPMGGPGSKMPKAPRGGPGARGR